MRSRRFSGVLRFGEWFAVVPPGDQNSDQKSVISPVEGSPALSAVLQGTCASDY